ncbi:hypothetical protein GLW05_11740 [Pontibacillus yanchengensis]|uniref:Uncharacterized protein n=1 Tax=Pontibacillus yanchengensis TaxID=462910 RepID=A0A6I5A173_9BACI|nr:Ig-like domain-containing protein [Pontibacillus yanchengensis]MYL34270.1 hypothetical protein [Pontibacillus yanchengensis]
MNKSPFKVMTTAALASAVAVPAVVAGAAAPAEAAEVEIQHIAIEDSEGTVWTITMEELADAQFEGDGEVYDLLQDGEIVGVSVEEGEFVSYTALVNAVFDSEDDRTSLEILADISDDEEALVPQDQVDEYKDFGEPVTPMVESVSAINLIQAEVDFSGEGNLDEDVVKTAANYTLTTSDGTDINVENVEWNGDTATLTFESKVENQDTASLTIEPDVLNAEEEVVVEDISFFDATIPEAKSVELVGPNKFKIYFSEPIAEKGTVEVENGIYGITETTVNGNEVTVELSASSLSEGEYSVEVSDFADYAGFDALKETFTLDYEEDTTAPTAELTKATQTEVVVQFDSPVVNDDGETLSEDYFYHSYTSYTPDSVDVSDDGSTYTLDFSSNPLPEGDVDVAVDYDANDSVVQDEWGNELEENIMLNANVVADNEKPSVEDVKVKNEQTVKIYFSENVNENQAEDEDNYVFENGDGEEVDPADLTYTADSQKGEYYVTASFSSNLNGAYTVEVSDIDDTSLAENTIDSVTESFMVDDLTGPNLNEVTATGVDGDNADYVYVNFPEKMATSGEYSVLDKDNYLLADQALPENAKIEVFNDSSQVMITLPTEDDQVVTDQSLTVARVADSSGNASTMLSKTVDIDVESDAQITDVNQTDYKTVEITVDQPLKTVSADGFRVTQTDEEGTTTETLAAVDYEINDDNETVITGTLKADTQIDTDADDYTSLTVDSVEIVGDELVTETGSDVPASDSAFDEVDDEYNPMVAMNDSDEAMISETASGEFTITFTEDVNSSSLAATDFVITDDSGDKLTAGDDYTVSTDGSNEVVFNLEDTGDYSDYSGDLTVSTKEEVTYVYDTAETPNTIVPFEDLEVTVDQAAPETTVDSPDSAVTVDADNYTISGNTEANASVKVYEDTDGDGELDADETTVVQTVDADENGDYSASVSLDEGVDNEFLVTATDDSGNEGSAVNVPTITEDSTAATFSSSSISGDNTTITVTFDEEVYGEADQTEALASGDFTVTASETGGAESVTVSSVSHEVGTSSATLTIDTTNVDSDDTITVDVDADSVYDVAGNVTADDETTIVTAN